MIIFPIINFVLPLMLTCLVLVDDPPRCSECRKKMEMKINKNIIEEFSPTANSYEFNVNPILDKYIKKYPSHNIRMYSGKKYRNESDMVY